ncbi:MAG: hypothetical protein ACPLTR_00020 [Thermacetogeniaceae bacterium]
MVFEVFKGIANRFYSDFLLPDRLSEWRLLLEYALEYGYEVHSVKSFWQILRNKRIKAGSKYLVVRHDIDTDSCTAYKFWEIEKRLKLQTSYYFRLSTLDINLMQEIEAMGGEASYHYEELATYAKRKGLIDRNAVLAHLNVIRQIFAQNLTNLRKQTGLPMRIVASHGDWINRKLGLPNWIILEDDMFRKEVDIDLEVYDLEFMRFITGRYSDATYPKFWRPQNPLEAIKAEEPVVYILVHPRHWRANVHVNLLDDLCRLWEGATFYMKTLGRGR